MSEERYYSNGKITGCNLTSEDIVKIGESHLNTREILTHVQYLRHLEVLPEIKDNLLSAAIGKDHIDSVTHRLVVRTLCACFGGVMAVLIVVIGFLLTGEKLGIIGALHR